MIPIDSAWRDDSNDGHIVKLYYFDFIDENLDLADLEVDFGRAGHKADLFFAWKIRKKSSNEAHYTSNR